MTDKVLYIETDKLYPNPDQPRKVFDESALEELASSIEEHGVISPIIVTKRKDGYMIIAGERRWRASVLARAETVPVIVRSLDEKQIREVSLIENLQREDLSPVEAANAMKQLLDEYGMTQEQLAERLGKSRSTVANTLRLLTLNPEVLKYVAEGKLSAGHARALITLPDGAQLTIARKSVENGYSVRETEKAVRAFISPPKREKNEVLPKQKPNQSTELKDLIDRLQKLLMTKVSAIGNDDKGRIYIDYFTRDDLDRLTELVEKMEKQNKETPAPEFIITPTE